MVPGRATTIQNPRSAAARVRFPGQSLRGPWGADQRQQLIRSILIEAAPPLKRSNERDASLHAATISIRGATCQVPRYLELIDEESPRPRRLTSPARTRPARYRAHDG